ncbi:MAG TPA: efflux RND transporter periplasmic adaptor subunit [Cytophagaceae bacterium]|jgi:cobalt-zinc-cadmium efflux system membrane fusion protein|nr:efflux RND transporter periplasmic adaptor subunit [Cytophagaceae bacterium]
MRNYFLLSVLCLLLSACTEKKKITHLNEDLEKPQILNKGELIRFNTTPKMFELFPIIQNSLDGNIEAPAQVAATVLKPDNLYSETIILFDDPELTNLYTTLLQSIAHYARDKEFYERVQDMYSNSAATGKDLSEARTAMIEAATELSEKEARLKMYGFNPNELRSARPGVVWLISNVSESALSAIKTGKDCKVEFISYPGEVFVGRVSAIGEVLDNSTQTIKVRVTIINRDNKFKSGMFAKISFGLSESNILAVPQSALVTAEGETFVFKKQKNDFIRAKVVIGKQIGGQVIIKEGVMSGDTVVSKGTMLLKGMSFGY